MKALRDRHREGKYQEVGRRLNGRKEESGCFHELSKASDLLQSLHRVRKQHGLGVLNRAAPDVVRGQQHQTSLGIVRNAYSLLSVLLKKNSYDFSPQSFHTGKPKPL